MRERSTGRKVTVGGAVLLGLLFGALWTRAQSVSPIRFDEQVPVARAAVDGGSQVLDAYVAAVDSPVQGTREIAVPTAKITERCNDGDGCILRLFLSSSVGSTAAGAVRVKFFSTTQNSTVWRLHSLDGDLESTGSTTDGSSQGIESVTADDRNCLFSEERPTGDYALLALNSTIQPISNCVLRIDD